MTNYFTNIVLIGEQISLRLSRSLKFAGSMETEKSNNSRVLFAFSSMPAENYPVTEFFKPCSVLVWHQLRTFPQLLSSWLSSGLLDELQRLSGFKSVTEHSTQLFVGDVSADWVKVKSQVSGSPIPGHRHWNLNHWHIKCSSLCTRLFQSYYYYY